MSVLPSPGQRLLIVEDSLKNYVGHWYSYARGVAEFNEERGVEAEMACHADVDLDLDWSLPVHPIFSVSYADVGVYYKKPGLRRFIDMLRSNYRTYRELALHLETHPRYDLLFAPSVMSFQLIAWWFLIRRFGGEEGKIGAAVVLMRANTTQKYRPDGEPIFGLRARAVGWCLSWFRDFHRQGRVRFATDSDQLSREHEALCGMPFTVYPSAQVIQRAVELHREDVQRAPLLTSLGPARGEKGIGVLEDAIRWTLANEPDLEIRFLIQLPTPEKRAAGKNKHGPAEDLVASGRVEFIEKMLSGTEFEEILVQSDGILLPYRLKAYRARTSGVIIEAAMAGVPVIVTAGTTLDESRVRFAHGLSFEDGDVEGLARCMIAIARDTESFRKGARARVAEALEYHSSKRFLELLWSQVEEST